MGADDLQALVRRLEALMAERQELIERLERLAPDADAGDLLTLIAQRTREHEKLLADLAALLPPEDPSGPTPN